MIICAVDIYYDLYNITINNIIKYNIKNIFIKNIIYIVYLLMEDNSKILTVQERWVKLTDSSAIRVQKILEISQYALIYLLVGLLLGIFLEFIFPKDNQETVKNRSTVELIFLVSIQVVTIAVVSFYIHKIALLVPFLFKFTDDYIPGYKEEYKIGGGIALAIVFISSQPSLIVRMSELRVRVIGGLNQPML